ncbi:MAG: hypothetical protein R3B49_07825 [Phycisphaerales bacterium]
MSRFLLPLVAGVAASSAGAAIVSVTGQTLQIAAPPSVDSGVLVSTTHAFAFDESVGVAYDGPVDLRNLIPNVQYNISDAQNYGATGVFDSHMIHFDVTGLNTDTTLTGWVTFDQPVYAVIISNTKLDLTDATFGAAGTVYPFGVTNRGFSNSTDWVRLTASNTLQFNVRNTNTADQIRVLTLHVPAPASAGLLGAGLLAAARRRR